MDDKSASVWGHFLHARVHVSLELVKEIAVVKAASPESYLSGREQARKLEIQELLPADFLEADGHQILHAHFEHGEFILIHS